jgi:hypothetical protein
LTQKAPWAHRAGIADAAPFTLARSDGGFSKTEATAVTASPW